MLKKRLFKKDKKENEEMSLQITSMADIFTILLVFLLKSYATNSVNISPPAGLTLPHANASEPNFQALKIEVFGQGILIEGTPVLSLEKFNFTHSDLEQNGSSKILNRVLKKERDRELLISQKNPDVKTDSKLFVIADQKTPYSTLKTILASAALQGYTDFKLAVAKAE